MKLSNTSIVKGLSVEDSIVTAINEMFNERAAADYIDCLIVDGLVGVCVESEEKSAYTYTVTNYFIATKLNGTDFVRVDYCNESKMTWNR